MRLPGGRRRERPNLIGVLEATVPSPQDRPQRQTLLRARGTRQWTASQAARHDHARPRPRRHPARAHPGRTPAASPATLEPVTAQAGARAAHPPPARRPVTASTWPGQPLVSREPHAVKTQRLYCGVAPVCLPRGWGFWMAVSVRASSSRTSWWRRRSASMRGRSWLACSGVRVRVELAAVCAVGPGGVGAVQDGRVGAAVAAAGLAAGGALGDGIRAGRGRGRRSRRGSPGAVVPLVTRVLASPISCLEIIIVQDMSWPAGSPGDAAVAGVIARWPAQPGGQARSWGCWPRSGRRPAGRRRRRACWIMT